MGQAFDPSRATAVRARLASAASVGDGSDPGGVPPDEEKQGQEIERTWLDSAVELAGYLNLEFGEGPPEGDRYGVPGGWLGWIPGSKFTQSIYVAVNAVMAVITVIELAVGIGEAKLTGAVRPASQPAGPWTSRERSSSSGTMRSRRRPRWVGCCSPERKERAPVSRDAFLMAPASGLEPETL